MLLPALSLGFGFRLAAAPLAAPAARSVRAAIIVTGRVANENGAGLPGVNVIVKGPSNGTHTDADGRYSIKAAENATLIFTFVGYTTTEQAIALIMVPIVPRLANGDYAGLKTASSQAILNPGDLLSPVAPRTHCNGWGLASPHHPCFYPI